MIKKCQLLFCAAILLFFCGVNSALASYDRTPAGSTVDSPVSFDWGTITCSGNNYSMAIAPNTGGMTGYYILPLQAKTNPISIISCGMSVYNSDTAEMDTLPCPFTTVGDTQIMIGCSNNSIGSFYDWTGDIGNPVDEVDGDIFTMSEPESEPEPTGETSATTTLSAIGGSVINTSITFFNNLVLDYWPYVMVMSLVLYMLYVFGTMINNFFRKK